MCMRLRTGREVTLKPESDCSEMCCRSPPPKNKGVKSLWSLKVTAQKWVAGHLNKGGGVLPPPPKRRGEVTLTPESDSSEMGCRSPEQGGKQKKGGSHFEA